MTDQGASQLADHPFTLKVDRTKPLAELVEAGAYDYANLEITEDNFPQVSGEPKVEGLLMHPGRVVTSDEALREMDRLGLRPATMPELLAFGAQHPDRQRKFPILALGSVWVGPDGRRRVGSLWENPEDRELDLFWFDDQWDESYRFLAVRA